MNAKGKALDKKVNREAGKRIASMLSYTKKNKGHAPLWESRAIREKYPEQYEKFGSDKMKKKGRLWD